MKIKKALFVFFISIALVTAFVSMTGRTTHAQSSGASDSTVLNKLNEVLSNQKAIMEALSDIKERLRIVEVRVTQSQ